MNDEIIVTSVVVNPLGEIRMGCDAYGLVINTNFGTFELFKEMPMMIGHSDYSKCIEQSDCKNFLLLKGDFGVYILNIVEQSVSAYKVTIRTENNEWSEEQAIFGNEKSHINGFSRHYYLQFPFVKKELFSQVLAKYETLRKAQISVAVGAL